MDLSGDGGWTHHLTIDTGDVVDVDPGSPMGCGRVALPVEPGAARAALDDAGDLSPRRVAGTSPGFMSTGREEWPLDDCRAAAHQAAMARTGHVSV